MLVRFQATIQSIVDEVPTCVLMHERQLEIEAEKGKLEGVETRRLGMAKIWEDEAKRAKDKRDDLGREDLRAGALKAIEVKRRGQRAWLREKRTTQNIAEHIPVP